MKIIEITYIITYLIPLFPGLPQRKGVFCYLSKTLRFCKIPDFC